MNLLLALLVACGSRPDDTGPSPGPGSVDGTIECRGMVHSSAGLWRSTASAIPSVDPNTGTGSIRCHLLLSNTLSGGDVTMLQASAGLTLDVTADSGVGWLWADGTFWEVVSGTMRFDVYDDTLAEGTYSVAARSISPDGATTGREGRFDGPFSWCEGTREDCPFRFQSTLEKHATIDTPVLAETSAQPTACRMLVDSTTGALQVDLQLGVWDGRNVDQIWYADCGGFGVHRPQGNLLRFRAGGVTGPGTYGPEESWVRQGVRLPGLEFAHPAAWYPGLNTTQACSFFYFFQTEIQTPDGSTCSWTVDAAAETFELACEGVTDTSGVPMWPNSTGSFSLSTDCDYVER